MNKKLKNLVLIAAIIVSLALLISPMVLAKEGTGRYFIQSDSGLLRALIGVRWNFDNGFTTELTKGQLKAVEMLTSRLGILMEPVEQYHISAPPGTCSPWPECKNGGGGDSGTSRPATPTNQITWGVEKMYNNTALTATSGGLGVDVAVLDTGVYKEHLDLKRRVAQCKDFTGGGPPGTVTVRDNKCEDRNGHGTHVAGTILADAGADNLGIYGVAPEANLYAYKVCDNSGACWADDISIAIRMAADQKAEIISMSLGADNQSSLIRDAIAYATANNVLVVAAAGNDGPNLGSIDYPGANANVVAVGAIDSNENVTNWSSRGVNDGDYIIEEREVEFAAPGLYVESTWADGTYKVISGTSMATPHVSGLAAKLWQGTASGTRSYLQLLARDIWSLGDDPASGFGLPTL